MAVIADAAARGARGSGQRRRGGEGRGARVSFGTRLAAATAARRARSSTTPRRRSARGVEAADAVAAMHVVARTARRCWTRRRRRKAGHREGQRRAGRGGGARGEHALAARRRRRARGIQETRASNVDVEAATLAGARLFSSATATYKRTARAELRVEPGAWLAETRPEGRGENPSPAVPDSRAAASTAASRVRAAVFKWHGRRTTRRRTDTLVKALHERLCDAFGLERACAVSARVTACGGEGAAARRDGDDGRVDFAALFSRARTARPVPHGVHEPGLSHKTEKKAKKKEKKATKDKKDKKLKENTSGLEADTTSGNVSAGEVGGARRERRRAVARLWPTHDLTGSRSRSGTTACRRSSAAPCARAHRTCAPWAATASRPGKRIAWSRCRGLRELPGATAPLGGRQRRERVPPVDARLLPPDARSARHGGGGQWPTLFSDNHRYMRDLARTLAELTYDPAAGATRRGRGEPLSAREAALGVGEGRDAAARERPQRRVGGASFENPCEGVRLYRGVPGEGTGPWCTSSRTSTGSGNRAPDRTGSSPW